MKPTPSFFRFSRQAVLSAIVLAWTLSVAADGPSTNAETRPVYAIQVHQLPMPHWTDYAVFQSMLRNHPQIHYARVTQVNSDELAEGNLLMAIAGGTAPDILLCSDEPKSWIRQGFLEPLDKYIYKDTDGDGKYTEGIDEIIWKPWFKLHPQARSAVIENGHIYALPWYQWVQFLMYRRDIFAEQGIDPDKRITTFDELKYICQKLTDPNVRVTGARSTRGRKGIGLAPGGWYWQGWLYACGGQMVKFLKTCPKCKTEIEFPEQESQWRCKLCGTSLKEIPARERAAFNSPEGRRALELWKDLLWAPFVKCPHCREPVDLGKADARLAYPMTVNCGKCRKSFSLDSGKDVIIGCARSLIGDDRDWVSLWKNGEIVIMPYYSLHVIANSSLDSRVVGAMPFPEKGGGSAFHYSGIYSGAGQRAGGADRVRVCAEYILDYVAQFYVSRDDPQYLRYDKERVINLVDAGFYNICSYDELAAAGLEEYAGEITSENREMQRLIKDPAHYTVQPSSEGYMRVRDGAIENVALAKVAFSRDFDAGEQLSRAEQLANTQVFMKDEIVDEFLRKYGRYLLVAVILIGLGLAWFTVKQLARRMPAMELAAAVKITLGKKTAALCLILPAMLLIALWAYYPLLRGSVMAFQDVRIMGGSRFVNVENFVRVIMNPQFLIMLKATFIYVAAVLSLGFFAPVILALLLSEIKRGSVLLRLIYYAPYVFGGIVILFIWKIFYMPTTEGILNQIVGFVGLGPVRWLEDPRINKWALVLPSIWAGTGAGCLIYLAALKGIDDELYEAAEMDGAGILSKVWHITLPCLKPLLIINFVGAVIGAFQGMGNILILTGGRYETNIIGLQIFMEAFVYLRYGSATALAWILGSFLIGFTIVQLKILRKVEFRRVE